MNIVTLGNRPATITPRTRIVDFDLGDGQYVRVSMKQVEATLEQLTLSVQAFQVDSAGMNMSGPDGRPSRTQDTSHTINITGLVGGDRTHTLDPGWVRVVGTYDGTTFEATAPRDTTNPSAAPDWETNPTGQFYNTVTGVGYRWDEGEALRIARGKATDMQSIIAGSSIIAGIEF